ncbi:hypothetical protein PFISCL1PPCAC_25591, partial [Pristionchus fissidentatus]
GLEVRLTRESDNEIISSLLLPIQSPSSLVSLRIDPFLPLIFESGERIKATDYEEIVECKKIFDKFSLTVNPIHSSDAITNLDLTEIYSDFLKIGSTTVAVTREV